MAAGLAERWRAVRHVVWRGVYLASVLSFLLPFVTVVRGCTASTQASGRLYRGYDLLAEGGWFLLLLFPFVLACVLFAISFLRPVGGDALRGFQGAWRAVLAWVAGFVLVAVIEALFFFETVTSRAGRLLALTCWALVYVAGLAVALVSINRLRHAPKMPVTPPPGLIHVIYAGTRIVVGAVFLASSAWMVVAQAHDRYVLAGLALLAVPVGLAQHLLIKGIEAAEPWASTRGVAVTPLVPPAGLAAAVIVAAVYSNLGVPAIAAWLIVTEAAGIAALFFSNGSVIRRDG